jgi:hypothetical protein
LVITTRPEPLPGHAPGEGYGEAPDEGCGDAPGEGCNPACDAGDAGDAT